jgi:hypothetical protein
VYRSGYVAGGEVAVAVPTSDDSVATALERQVADLSAGECGAFGAWRPVEPVNVIPDGSCARYRTVIGEEPGEQLVAVADDVVRRDDTPPLAPELVIEEASENAHAVGDTLFYREAEGETGTFTVAAVADDPESGVARLSFPALGDTASTTRAAPDASTRYAWSGTDSADSGVVVATNAAGLVSEAVVELVGDADAPTGGFVSYSGGVHRDGRVEVSFDPGEDTTAGVEAALGVLEEREAPLARGRCRGAWGGWHSADGDGSPGRPACVRFRYRISDNVGNEAVYESSTVAKVIDEKPPAVTIIAPEDGASVGETVTLQAEADDAGVGVAAVRLEFSRSGRFQARWTPIATTTAAPYAVTWTTSALRRGRYYLRAVATDRAGNPSVSEPVAITIAEPVAPEPPTDDPGEHACHPPKVPPNEDGGLDADQGDVGEQPASPADGDDEAPADDEEAASAHQVAESEAVGVEL